MNTCLYDGKNTVVFPITKDELILLQQSPSEFSKYINVAYDGIDMTSDFMQEPIKEQLELLDKYPDFWEWHAFWLVLKADIKTIVGSLCFKTNPSLSKEIEIGYGINSKYENNGITTKAVELATNWAFNNGSTCIVATTEKDNKASIRVLEKNDYKITTVNENFICWKKEKYES